jgi:hypothetical protein
VTESQPEPSAPLPLHEPRETDLEDAKVNNLIGLALFGLFVLLFGGTVLVGFLYLAFD